MRKKHQFLKKINWLKKKQNLVTSLWCRTCLCKTLGVTHHQRLWLWCLLLRVNPGAFITDLKPRFPHRHLHCQCLYSSKTERVKVFFFFLVYEDVGCHSSWVSQWLSCSFSKWKFVPPPGCRCSEKPVIQVFLPWTFYILARVRLVLEQLQQMSSLPFGCSFHLITAKEFCFCDRLNDHNTILAAL